MRLKTHIGGLQETMMTTEQFSKVLCQLVERMMNKQYPKWLIQTTLGFIQLVPANKMEEATKEMVTLVEKGLEEMELHHEINKVFRKYHPKRDD